MILKYFLLMIIPKALLYNDDPQILYPILCRFTMLTAYMISKDHVMMMIPIKELLHNYNLRWSSL